MAWIAWDTRATFRALSLGASTLLLAFVVTAVSDEGGVSVGERLGRVLPLAPICAALGTWGALAPATWRGEIAALASLGRTPWQNIRAAALGGGLVAAVVALFVARNDSVRIDGFFPPPPQALGVHYDGTAFIDDQKRWRIRRDGRPEIAPVPAPSPEVPQPHSSSIPTAWHDRRTAASLSTLLGGLAWPLVAAMARRPFRKILPLGLNLGAQILCIHAAASERAPAFAAAIPPLALLAWAIWNYRETRA